MTSNANRKNEIDDTGLKELFGSNIRHIRKLRGLSQLKLSEVSNVSPDTIGRLERGNVGASFATILAIAKALEVQEHVLFDNGFQVTMRGPRSRLLNGINVSLSKMSDDDLHRAKKLLEALTA